jgi:F0F1-type ATP synthase assembly protein I
MINKEEKDKAKKYLKFSDLGFRMLGFIVFGAVVGHFVDKWLGFEKPYGSVVLILMCIAGSLYMVIKETSSK